MKKWCFLMILLASLLFALPAFAVETEDVLWEEENTDSGYDLYYDGELVMSVSGTQEFSSAAPGGFMPLGSVSAREKYFAIDFLANKDENEWVFLHGLTDRNVAAVQDWLTKNINNNGASLSDIDFIDAEKLYHSSGDGDDLMCWAASCSDVLYYTGWAERAAELNPDMDLNNEDDVFEYFIDSFTDAPGNSVFGVPWFFNGVYEAQQISGWSQVKAYGETGGLLPQYDVNRYFSSIKFDSTTTEGYMTQINQAEDLLRAGAPCGISIDIGHAVTLWGFAYDKDFSRSNTGYYTACFLTDSDSIQWDEDGYRSFSDRRNFGDYLTMFDLSVGQTTDNSSKRVYCPYLTDYYQYQGGIAEMHFLLPYDKDYPYETKEYNGTLNHFDDPNLTTLYDIPILLTLGDEYHRTSFEEDDSILVGSLFANTGYGDVNGSFSIRYELRDSANRIIWQKDHSFYSGLSSGRYYSLPDAWQIGTLPEGVYTITLTIDPDNAITEALEHDNVYTEVFTVGDVELGITDVTENHVTIYAEDAETVVLVAAVYNGSRMVDVESTETRLVHGANHIDVSGIDLTAGNRVVVYLLDDDSLAPISLPFSKPL